MVLVLEHPILGEPTLNVWVTLFCFDSFGDHRLGRFGDVSVMTFVDVFSDQGPNVGLPRN